MPRVNADTCDLTQPAANALGSLGKVFASARERHVRSHPTAFTVEFLDLVDLGRVGVTITTAAGRRWPGGGKRGALVK